jgi:hypothetical protein
MNDWRRLGRIALYVALIAAALIALITIWDVTQPGPIR